MSQLLRSASHGGRGPGRAGGAIGARSTQADALQSRVNKTKPSAEHESNRIEVAGSHGALAVASVRRRNHAMATRTPARAVVRGRQLLRSYVVCRRRCASSRWQQRQRPRSCLWRFCCTAAWRTRWQQRLLTATACYCSLPAVTGRSHGSIRHSAHPAQCGWSCFRTPTHTTLSWMSPTATF